MYKHGVYGELVEQKQQMSTLNQGTIPFYVGTAPIHRIKNNVGLVNTPLLINNLEEAKTKLGYSNEDDFEKYTLSAPIYAHFKNKIQPIGPITVLNVLDPSKHFKSDSEEVTVVNNIGYITKDAVIDSVKISEYEKDVDYIVEYKENKLKITFKNEVVSPVTATFDAIDITNIEESDIIGEYNPNTDKRTGLNNINIVYEELGVVPSIVSVPGWNHNPKVHTSILEACKNIGGHWNAICVTDLDPTLETIEEAKKWKSNNGYNDELEKPCWPKGEINGRAIWMSILAIIRMQQTDLKNNNVPYESPSNKPIDITNLIINGKKSKYNQEQGNRLNEKGITTAIYNGGKWVLWGPHMGNYEFGVTEVDQSNFGKLFDVNIRTKIYLLNDFQLRNSELVDTPIARNDIDAILNTEQMRLNSLISDGKLLYGEIKFEPTTNTKSDLVQGDFKFDTAVTTTPPGKSITNRIQYTSKGIDNLLEGDE